MRSLWIVLTIVALTAMMGASASAAYVYFESGSTSSNIVITATIPAWAQAEWQDTTIVFDSQIGGNNDWFRNKTAGAVDSGAYAQAAGGADEEKASSVDPWAGHTNGVYYESYDAAHVYVRTNCNIRLWLGDNGALTSGSNTLPTWFTLAAAGPGGALIGGTLHTDGSIPVGNPGVYAGDGPNAGDISFTGINNSAWGTQDCFVMDGTNAWTSTDLDGPCEFTLSFHGRIERNGPSDPAGAYSTSISMTLLQP